MKPPVIDMNHSEPTAYRTMICSMKVQKIAAIISAAKPSVSPRKILVTVRMVPPEN